MFDDAHPLEILRWAGETYAEGLVVTASCEDAVLVHLVSQAVPGADVVLLDTGYLFAETTWFAQQLAERLDLSIRVIAPRPGTATNIWQRDTNACCGARKVEPLERAIAGKAAWVTGVRRVDSPTRATTPVVHDDLLRGITKINPLATWTDADMGAYAAAHELPEHPLRSKGYVSIGCWPCTRPISEGEDPRAGRWSGQEKTECGLHLPVTAGTATS